MASLIRKYIFAGSEKNVTAPYIFMVLCVYALLISTYTGLFFGTQAMLMRIGLSLAIVLSYVIIERSAAGNAVKSFLSPVILVGILTFGSMYFKGDFLLFTYNIGIAMISLTYLRPKSLALYITLSSTVFAIMLFGFRMNLLGPAFTEVYNILYYLVSVALNILIYIFCKSYVNALDELTAAKNEASLAAHAKGNFLANMSHEIRTPLNAIIGLTEAELRRDLPQTNAENLRKIHASGNLLIGIVNDILDMSKIESGKFEILPAQYDIVNMIYDTVALNIVRIKSRPIEFVVSVSESIPRLLKGDELRIKQLLNNLLSNAFKYTRKGKVELRVTWQAINDGAELTFEIADTGIGIRDKDLKMLFAEYSQVHQRKFFGIEGTGLGLNISKGLVELMGGKIWAQSEYGVGSVFTAKISQEIIDNAPIGEETANALMDYTYTPDYSQSVVEYTPMPYARVLVVDDVEINLEVAAACLEPYEIQVDCVESGAEAVQRIKDEEPVYDLIFMDHMMPEMDGIEAVEAIRKLGTQYAAGIPVVALTANALAGNEKLFIENGFQGFLAKPIEMHKLDALLHTLVQKDMRVERGERRVGKVERRSGETDRRKTEP